MKIYLFFNQTPFFHIYKILTNSVSCGLLTILKCTQLMEFCFLYFLTFSGAWPGNGILIGLRKTGCCDIWWWEGSGKWVAERSRGCRWPGFGAPSNLLSPGTGSSSWRDLLTSSLSFSIWKLYWLLKIGAVITIFQLYIWCLFIVLNIFNQLFWKINHIFFFFLFKHGFYFFRLFMG